MEVWKNIDGFEGYYQISNFGHVKSLARNTPYKKSIRPIKERILKQAIAATGYPTIALHKNASPNTCYIHRLLLAAFVPNPENKRCCNHIDGNKENNRLENLEWSTHSENEKHAYDTGLKVCATPLGERHGNAVLTEKKVIEIHSLKGKMSISKLSERFRVSKTTIKLIRNGKAWSHLCPTKHQHCQYLQVL